MLDHPAITDPHYSTWLLSWQDGGFRFFEPVGPDGIGILDTYYLSYALVILISWVLFRRWQANGSLKCHRYQLYDMAIVTILGVLIGSKLAYVLFYFPEYYIEHPSEIFLNWSGMAGHGSFAGVGLGFWWYCRRTKLNPLHVLDHAVLGAIWAAILCRFANWLNGELYGRSASADLPWASRFVMRDELGNSLWHDANGDLWRIVTHRGGEALQRPLIEAVESAPPHAFESFQTMAAQFPRADFPHLWQTLQPTPESPFIDTARMITDPSHPSQIYEAILGGVVLMILLYIVRARTKIVGTVAATFLIGYGLVRIFIEFFRQQDIQRSGGLFDIISMGQLLSIVLVTVGVIVLRRARRLALPIGEVQLPPLPNRRNAPPSAPPPPPETERDQP